MVILYIHGYGSNGNALKAKKLQTMFPTIRVVSPTFDYDRLAPQDIYQRLKQVMSKEKPNLVLGSSMGGYYALCCSNFYDGTIWCINPVRDVLTTIDRHLMLPTEGRQENISNRIREYEDFDRSIFRQLKPIDGQLHFALSTDDELLGDHKPLLQMFPNYGRAIWKDNCHHCFLRFDELQGELLQSLQAQSSQGSI